MKPIRALLATGSVACLLAGSTGTAAAATTIYGQPDPGTGVPCVTADPLGDCELPMVGAISAPGVLTYVRDSTPDSADLTEPSSGFTLYRPSTARPGTYDTIGGAVFSGGWPTRISVVPGDRIELDGPTVVQQPAATEPTFSSVPDPDNAPNGRMTIDGPATDLRAYGTATVETDSDNDGWGDDTQDNCVGAPGPECAPGRLTVAVKGPAAVPSLGGTSPGWSVTNLSAGPEPLLVRFAADTSAINPGIFTSGAPGASCGPASNDSLMGRLLPSSRRSALLQQTSIPTPISPYALPAASAGHSYVDCIFPAVAPGVAVSGTASAPPGSALRNLRVDAYTEWGLPSTDTPGTASATYSAPHPFTGLAQTALRPSIGKASAISAKGVVSVTAGCSAYTLPVKCKISGALLAGTKTSIGRAHKPVSLAPGKHGSLKLTFSAKGLKWLAAHPRGEVRVRLTSVRPGELADQRSTLIHPRIGSALKRKLRALKAH
jgi:hypothetical protein